MNYLDYINVLKKEISFCVGQGLDIYSPRREIPFYDKLRYAASIYKLETSKTIPVERVYFDCGIKFDREYERYCRLMKVLPNCVKEDGFIHFDQKNKIEYDADNLIKSLSSEIGITPSEYLILMTPFRAQTVMTSGNYVEHIVEHLNKTFPDKVVKNVKRVDNDLYEEIRHFQKYSPVPITFDEAIEFFGFQNGNSRKSANTTGNYPMDPEELSSLLLKEYPERNIGHLLSDNKQLYYQVVSNARANDQTIEQWLNNKGFEYPFAQNAERLNRYKVDAIEHEQKLLEIKNQLLPEYKTEQADEFDQFEINFDIAKRVSNIIHKEDVKFDNYERDFIVDSLKKPLEQVASIDNQNKQIEQ